MRTNFKPNDRNNQKTTVNQNKHPKPPNTPLFTPWRPQMPYYQNPPFVNQPFRNQPFNNPIRPNQPFNQFNPNQLQRTQAFNTHFNKPRLDRPTPMSISTANSNRNRPQNVTRPSNIIVEELFNQNETSDIFQDDEGRLFQYIGQQSEEQENEREISNAEDPQEVESRKSDQAVNFHIPASDTLNT